MNRKGLIDLLVYVQTQEKIDYYNQKVHALDDKLEQIDNLVFADDAVDLIADETLDALAKEAHELRTARLGYLLKVNNLEHKILQFELEEELRD